MTRRRILASAGALAAPAVQAQQRRRNIVLVLAGYVAPGLLDGLASARMLFYEDSLRVREGAWTGPVAILMDGRTASASEQFATLLRDNNAAVLIGQRSLGAGCGYTNEGIKMPDCARFRANGENEIAGFDPDVAVASAAELRPVLLRMA